MEVLLRAEGLTKRFGPKVAVRGISLTLGQGEVLGFLGPNGAGKSTTMKMLTGYLRPTSGSASVCGAPVTTGEPSVREAIGYLPEGAPLYGDMTVEDFLGFIADAHQLSGEYRSGRLSHAVSALKLETVLMQRIETLSKGFKRRVGLAAAILHDPKVLILDEPTDGLDPNQKRQVRALIRDMSHDRAIIISTHILEEVDALCTRAVVISAGEVVADGTPDALRARSRYAGAVTLTVNRSDADDVKIALGEAQGVLAVEDVEEGEWARLTAVPKPGADLAGRLNTMIRERGWTVHAFGIEPGRLEDVFYTLTGGDLA